MQKDSINQWLGLNFAFVCLFVCLFVGLLQEYCIFTELIKEGIMRMVEERVLSNGGVIFLPFKVSIFGEIVDKYYLLKKRFKIDFVTSEENLLCATTNSLGGSEFWMQFGKPGKEEDRNCVINHRSIRECVKEDHRKDDVMRLFDAIRNHDNVRFIRMEECGDNSSHLGYSRRTVEEIKGSKRKMKSSSRKKKFSKKIYETSGTPTIPTQEPMLLWDGTTFSANGSDVVGVMNIAREKKSKLDDETIRDIVTIRGMEKALIELKIALEEKMDDVCEDAYAEVQLYEEKWLEEAHREKNNVVEERR